MIMSYNGHGDIVLVRSVSGETLAEYAYDEFGNPLSDGISLQFTIEPVESAEEKTDYSQEIVNPYRYAGYEYLDSVDLYDLNARYYNPKTARFLSEDPYYNLGNRVIGLYEINVPNVLSIMQANALYAYCGNMPITLIDLTGESVTLIAIGTVLLVGMTLLLTSCTPNTGKIGVSSKNVYVPDEYGYYGTRGNSSDSSIRHMLGRKVEAFDFFNSMCVSIQPTSNGYIGVDEDGTIYYYRETSSDGTAVVSINGKNSGAKSQKIHFVS